MAFDRKAYMTAYHKANYQTNKREIAAKNKTYKDANEEKISAYKHEWYEQNKTKVKANARKHYLCASNSGKRRQQSLKKLYGLSIEQYDVFLTDQQGLCAICHMAPSHRLHVDHNHASGQVRGLLCSKCNFGIGLFMDDVTRLQSAIRYLSEAVNDKQQ